MARDNEPEPVDHEDASPPSSVRRDLRGTYGRLARRGTVQTSCCVPNRSAPDQAGAERVPSEARDLGLGCGDPVSLAELEPGQTVLDLGSGAGGDCFRAVERVGPTGRVIGVDMTPEMLDRARSAAQRSGAGNVEFRLGEIEHLPVADEAADVVLSNCVINLSPDKQGVLREAYRVLRPNGRLALSETMTDGPLPEAVRTALGSAADGVWAEADYVAAIEAAGFVDVSVERVEIDPSVAAEGLDGVAPADGAQARVVMQIGETGETRVVDLDELPAEGMFGQTFSGRVRARKPATPPPA